MKARKETCSIIVERWMKNLNKNLCLVAAAAAGYCLWAAAKWLRLCPKNLWNRGTLLSLQLNDEKLIQTPKKRESRGKEKKWSASGRVCSLSPEVAPAPLRAAALNVSPLSGTQQLVMRPKQRSRLLTGSQSSSAAICLLAGISPPEFK